MGVVGVAVGTAISFAGGRGLTAALNAPHVDPLLFALVPHVLLATTVLAALYPARVNDPSATGAAPGLRARNRL
jgi:hypothetical protein